jgi:hypothetical protein
MTIIAVVIAYTVPKQVDRYARDRDQQTLFAMKQYARMPSRRSRTRTRHNRSVSITEAGPESAIRGTGELMDPLTGKVDWILIPMTNHCATGPAATRQQRRRHHSESAQPDRSGMPGHALPAADEYRWTRAGFVGPISGRPSEQDRHELSQGERQRHVRTVELHDGRPAGPDRPDAQRHHDQALSRDEYPPPGRATHPPFRLTILVETLPYVFRLARLLPSQRSAVESEEHGGASHFEHLGSKEQRTAPPPRSRKSSTPGGDVDAFTGKEYTSFYAHVLDEQVDTALELLTDIVAVRTFPTKTSRWSERHPRRDWMVEDTL